MRHSLSCSALILVSALSGSGVLAAPSMPVPADSLSAGPTVAPAPVPLHITPHRALYMMHLANIKNGSKITDVSGRMLFEWRDVCDGWAIQQHLQLHFAYTDGADQDVISNELTWESKDGKKFNFNIRRLTNGKETENDVGNAELRDDKGGEATYDFPADKHVDLPAGALFPSAHTQLILQKAALGEKLFTRRVFDGSDEDGSSDISAFISPRPAKGADAQLPASLRKNPLLSDTAWPVHLAFYKIGSETGEPDYEMDMNLLPNGIVRRMKIDYGDFAVTGDLQEVQPLPPQDCP